MPDAYTLCQNAFHVQLQTLSDQFFPEVTGREAGWQVSENDLMPLEGSDYFVITRPGDFTQVRRGQHNMNDWHITTTIYMRFKTYETLWSLYREFRGAILDLPETAPLKTAGIYGQSFVSRGQPGFVIDTKTGNTLDMVAQEIDVTINQKILVTRNL